MQSSRLSKLIRWRISLLGLITATVLACFVLQSFRVFNSLVETRAELRLLQRKINDMSAVITPVLEVSEIRCDGGPQEFANEETIVYSYEIDGAIPFEIEFICDQKRIIGRPTKNTVNGQDRYSIEVEVVVVHIGDLKKIQIAAGCKVGCGSCGMQVRNYVLPVRDNFKDCGGSSWIVDANDIAISTRFELLSLQMTGNNSPQFVVSAVPLAEWGIVHQ